MYITFHLSTFGGEFFVLGISLNMTASCSRVWGELQSCLIPYPSHSHCERNCLIKQYHAALPWPWIVCPGLECWQMQAKLRWYHQCECLQGQLVCNYSCLSEDVIMVCVECMLTELYHPSQMIPCIPHGCLGHGRNLVQLSLKERCEGWLALWTRCQVLVAWASSQWNSTCSIQWPARSGIECIAMHSVCCLGRCSQTSAGCGSAFQHHL